MTISQEQAQNPINAITQESQEIRSRAEYIVEVTRVAWCGALAPDAAAEATMSAADGRSQLPAHVLAQAVRELADCPRDTGRASDPARAAMARIVDQARKPDAIGRFDALDTALAKAALLALFCGYRRSSPEESAALRARRHAAAWGAARYGGSGRVYQ